MEVKTCRFGHECTSRCGNDIDCPCQAEHCCALTYGCDGRDDYYEAPREFSKEQVNIITRMELEAK